MGRWKSLLHYRWARSAWCHFWTALWQECWQHVYVYSSCDLEMLFPGGSSEDQSDAGEPRDSVCALVCTQLWAACPPGQEGACQLWSIAGWKTARRQKQYVRLTHNNMATSPKRYDRWKNKSSKVYGTKLATWMKVYFVYMKVWKVSCKNTC